MSMLRVATYLTVKTKEVRPVPKEHNPFCPTRPGYDKVFAGRRTEVSRIAEVLRETKEGNPTNLLLLGERGFGKTSLLMYAKALATGQTCFEPDDPPFNFLVIWVTLTKRSNLDEFIGTVLTELRRELCQANRAEAFFKQVWEFATRLEVASIKLNPAKDAPPATANDLTYALLDTVREVTADHSGLGLSRQKDGIVLIIDEADNAPKDLELGELIKYVTDRAAAANIGQLVVITAGLPEATEVLQVSHKSAKRAFEERRLAPLADPEVKEVIRIGLNEANKKNKTPVDVDDAALESIVFFSEGYPHFVQQFGYSAYSADTDHLITDLDVRRGAFAEHGALSKIGASYYHDMYYKEIQESSYRTVLQAMAQRLDDWQTKDEIRRVYYGRNLDNALQALTERRIILRNPEVRGSYRLHSRGFASWIKLISSNATSQAKS
jgi:hypothetical protein